MTEWLDWEAKDTEWMSSMRFVGIDVSLRETGISILKEVLGKGVFEVFSVVPLGKYSRATDMKKFDYIIKQVEYLTKKGDWILIEGYAFAASGQITRIAELTGQIKRMIYLLNGGDASKMLTCSPSTLKKYVSGKGNTRKELVLRDVYRRWGFDAPSNDQADAYSLSRLLADYCYYLCFDKFRENSMKYEQEAVLALKKQNS